MQPESRRRIGSVKDPINSYGEKLEDSPHPQACSRTRELHMARRDIFRFKESSGGAEDAAAEAESELSNAKRTVRDLSALIEQSNSKLRAEMKNPIALGIGNNNNTYETVMRELEHVKQELSKLKMDMASVLEDKASAVKQSQASHSKAQSCLSSVQLLEKEIEEASEEQVVAELARIEALREFGAIEAERDKEVEEFSSALETTRKKMKELMEEMEHSKELEAKLSATTADVNALQNELKLVKEMKQKEPNPNPSSSPLLEELEAAKRELACIKDEGFQFMTSMDVIRNELIHVTQETSRLKKSGDKADLTVQNLNSKLLRAQAKLETASAAGEKAKSIANSLSLTLEQLKVESEASKKESALIREETAAMNEEIQKTERQIDSAEERLEASMQELEAVKLSEAMALESLKSLIENTIRARASAAENSSSITISKFEYDYLTGRATGAEEIADKKVAAAQAWIEALKASEKEMQMKTEMAQRQMGEKLAESPPVKRQQDNMQMVLPPGRRMKHRKSASPGGRYMGRSTSLTIKHRQKVMPNLTNFFSGTGNAKDLSPAL